MDRTTVYTKTAKGITQVNQKSASLSKDLMKVLKLIDGKSNFGQIMEKADLDQPSLTKALNTLSKDGFARVFQVRKEEADPFGGEDDFDFTAPGKMPASTQRVVPGAANDISELVRQQEKSDAARKAANQAATQANDAARAKAKEQAEAKARADAEARARVEAEQKAMEQAQRAKEAADRAKAEVEAKMREEAARKVAHAAQQAKLTAEQKAKEEEEQRRLAEARVRAEKEAKALAEARARADAEAAAMAQARATAEAAAKKQAAEASQADAAMRARMKEEIELRIRSEMEDLLRNEVEEKTREEMRASILEEAKLAAKAELEERLHDERESIQKAELEARTKAEGEQRARADKEAKLREEAEARAATAIAAAQKAEEEARRIKAHAEEEAKRLKAQAEEEARKLKLQAETEARRRAEAEAKAREEAAARAREQAEVHARLEAEKRAANESVEAERRAKYEAEARAKIEAEESEKRQRELQESLESERKAKAEAENRAKIAARASETVAEETRAKVHAELEQDMEKRAAIEGKAQAKAYMEAKAKAELDEDDRIRAEQSRKAREIADVLRTRVEPDEVAPEFMPAAKRKRRGKRKGLAKTILFALVASVILAIGLLHVIPLRNVSVKIEQSLGAWLHDDVSIGSLTFRMLPTPHLRMENIAVGKLLDAKASSGRIYLDIPTIFSEHMSINAIELDGVSLTSEAVARIPKWGAPEGKSALGALDSIKLRGVKLDVKPALEPFDANLTFNRDGTMRLARLSSGAGWSLAMKPLDKGSWDLDFTGRNWTLPIGLPVAVSEVAMKGTLSGTQILVPEFEASTLEGKVQGTLKVDWTTGVRMESDLSLSKINAQELVSSFTKDVSVTGKLDGNFTVACEGTSLEDLFAAPRTQGKFRIVEGSVSNIDLVAVMQSDAAGQRAGVTKFLELTGEYAGAEHRASYKNITLQGGVLHGTGGLDIGNNSSLAGHLALEIRSQVAQDRGSFSVAGTVGRPIVKRGG